MLDTAHHNNEVEWRCDKNAAVTCTSRCEKKVQRSDIDRMRDGDVDRLTSLDEYVVPPGLCAARGLRAMTLPISNSSGGSSTVSLDFSCCSKSAISMRIVSSRA